MEKQCVRLSLFFSVISPNESPSFFRETDLDEVLQIHNVFTNVSKGQLASKEDLKKCFKTEEVDKVIQEVYLYDSCNNSFIHTVVDSEEG